MTTGHQRGGDDALADHLIALKPERVRPGMYVAALDRLWLHTPFPPGGFFIRNEDQIRQIGRYCTYIYIDPLKSEEPDDVIVPFEPINPTSLAPRKNQHGIGDELPWARLTLSSALYYVAAGP